jgi:hypothetical protein
MTKKQLRLYHKIFQNIREALEGYDSGDVEGLSVDYEYEKGTFYIQGHGYLDDLVTFDEVPESLIPKKK